jgi:glutamate dehydrogenase
MQPAEVRQRFFAQMKETIATNLDGSDARRLDDFSRIFFENASLDEIKDRRPRDIYGAIFGTWSFIQEFDPRKPKLRLFNPDFEKHGWQNSHTVLALLIRDIPFAIDSIRLELNARDIAIHTVHGVKLRVVRDDAGRLQQISSANHKAHAEGRTEALYQLEIGRCSEGRELRELSEALMQVLGDVEIVVDDFRQMRSQIEKLEEDIVGWQKNVSADALEEGVHFLRWLHNNHFTFLGVETLQVSYENDRPHVQRVVGSERGLLKRRSTSGVADLVHELTSVAVTSNVIAPRTLESLITFSKSSVRSRVHRRAHPDYIAVRLLDDKGRITRVVRFLGLFTSATYTTSALSIPLVRQKVSTLLQRADVNLESHEGKSLLRVIETFPRDELFVANVDELFRIITAVHAIAERKQVRLFLRGDAEGKFYSCFVYTPKDIYNTELREKIQATLFDALNAVESEFNTYFSESVLTRVHFIFRAGGDAPVDADEGELEKRIVRASKSWEDMLGESLAEEFGEERGTFYLHLYERAFPPGYQHDFDPRVGVTDIKAIRHLDNENDIGLSLYRVLEDKPNVVRFRLFHIGEPLILSDIMPILENLGLRAVGERPYGIVRHDRLRIWIHEFTLIYGLADEIDIGTVKEKFQEAFLRVWRGDADNDTFNRLVLGTRLDWRDVAMLRAYARYMKQINVKFSTDFIAEALAHHLGIAQQLAEFFTSRLDPHYSEPETERTAYTRGLQERIVAALDKVENLSEDRVIRGYLELIQATLRTNFFVRDGLGNFKPCMSFKFNPALISDVPQPKPMFEIYVYSPRVEGVHLRRGKVARGGLRWSDRLEDYRTEVLGLVKAQQVKNAVIVPVGAKGGFVCRRLSKTASREEVQAEGIACYQIFVRGILDLTDNLIGGAVVPPADVKRFDEDDYYLVVAADKGTASFSDIANAISAEYNFWLGDAFASGGSIGYDHKKIGITARGAWVSVERNFRERGLNTQTTDFTVVGIGDMSGDVFGNGLLRSEHTKLVAAFDHRHIFIDPEPDAAASFVERQRLFNLPRSSWADYNSKLISNGGGVFSRNAKSIAVSDAMKQRFDIPQSQLTPSELIAALLKAPVDLIWNGGIGTYIKASRESHADAGDKSNDSLRVDGAAVRARVIGEGGNLGMTQLARIEYALLGGALNTDFIDNSAGVDCSDHEVNIKILLNEIVASGDMTEKQRRELLEQMQDSVAELVLQNNYRQTQAISIAAYEALVRTGEYRRLISSLEAGGHLNRALEFIPDDDTLAERRTQKKALTRPELSILIAYVKGLLKQELATSSLPDDPYISRIITTAFPPLLDERFSKEMARHRLRREIIATQAANDMVNRMGITFVERMRASTGYGSADITRAYITARDIFGMREHWAAIEALDNRIDNNLQLQLFSDVTRLVRRASRWLLRNRRSIIDPAAEVARFLDSVSAFHGTLGDLLSSASALRYEQHCCDLEEQGVPITLAKVVAGAPALYSMLGIVEAAKQSDVDLNDVAKVYFRLGEVLELDWFAKQIADLHIENHWQALARESFRDDLEWQQRSLTVGVLKHISGVNGTEEALKLWLESQAAMVERWRLMLVDLHNAQTQDFAMYSVAVRELLDLAQSSSHSV